jgi:hypothetical protein
MLTLLRNLGARPRFGYDLDRPAWHAALPRLLAAPDREPPGDAPGVPGEPRAQACFAQATQRAARAETVARLIPRFCDILVAVLRTTYMCVRTRRLL